MKTHRKIFHIRKPSCFEIIVLIFLTLLAASFLFLVFWAMITSFKDIFEFRKNVFGLPEKWTFENYLHVIKNFKVGASDPQTNVYSEVGFGMLMVNTVIYVLGCALTTTAIPFLAAYLNAKYNYKLNKVITAFVIIALVLPIVGAEPATVSLLRAIGLYNTRFAIPLLRGSIISMYFLIMCATFRGIPNELSEAAEVDGASQFRVMVQIVMPMALNIFGVVFLLQAVAYWNEYTATILYQPSYPTLAVGVFQAAHYSIRGMGYVPRRLAVCCLLMIPIFIIFLAFHNKMMGNLQLGGLKE